MENKARLIDARVAQKIADKELTVSDAGTVQFVLSHTPTIDPESLRPVGEWIPYYEDVEIYNTGGFTERKQTGWICGRCKSKESITPYYRTRYCPNCGARMKGVNDD